MWESGMDMGKLATIMLIAILTASSPTAFALSASASTSKPSVPEFNLKFVAHPYDVAPTTTIDHYTGKTITTHYGYHDENKSEEVTIKNQPFTSTLDASGNYTSLYYNVRYKGHYTNEWTLYGYHNVSNSDYTVISIRTKTPADGKMDFQVRAFIGHRDKKVYDSILPPEMKYYYDYVGQAGDWSETQTINLDESAAITTPTVSPSQSTPNPTPSTAPSKNPAVTPSQPITQTGLLVGFDWEKTALVVMAVAIAGLAVAVVVLWRKVAAK